MHVVESAIKLSHQASSFMPDVTLPELPKKLHLPNINLKKAFHTANDTAAAQFKNTVQQYRKYVFGNADRNKKTVFDSTTPRHKETFGKYNFRGMEFHAENPKELLVLITGCKSRTTHWKDQIDRWVSEGKSVVVFNTNVPRKEVNFVEDNYKMVQWLLRDENSPAHKIAKEHNIPIKVVSHSFAGYLVTRSLAEQGSADDLKNKIKRFVFINPFLTAKSLNADTFTGRISKHIYESHAGRNHDTYNGAHPFDIVHAHFQFATGEPHIFTADIPPTHGQVIRMQQAADALRADIAENGFPDSALSAETHFFLGQRDYMSDRVAGEKMAQQLGAKLTIAEGAYHNPLHENPDNLDKMNEILSPKAAARASAKEIARQQYNAI